MQVRGHNSDACCSLQSAKENPGFKRTSSAPKCQPEARTQLRSDNIGPLTPIEASRARCQLQSDRWRWVYSSEATIFGLCGASEALR